MLRLDLELRWALKFGIVVWGVKWGIGAWCMGTAGADACNVV